MLPPRAAAERGSFVADPKAMREWLDRLQLANRGFTLTRLQDALRQLNAAVVAPKARLAMLEMLELTSAALVDDAKNEAREFFPMSTDRYDDAQLAAEIERELAIGYAEIVCDLCTADGKVSFLRRSVVAKALMRACLHQSVRLWLAWRMHGEPAAGTWQSLHDLFRFAVASGCADAEYTVVSTGAKTSARAIYTQAVLHAFARPNQFTQVQNRQLHMNLAALASWCEVRPGHAPIGAIAIYAAGDLSPPAPPRGAQIDADDRWVLDISGLLAQFDALLDKRGDGDEIVVPARRGGARAALPAGIVEVLRSVWSERSEREHPRSADETLLETEVGLSGLHFLLSGNQDFETALPLGGEAPTAVASWAQRTPSRATVRRARAEAVDRSRRGYRLRWNAGEDARARVGELIAVAPLARGEQQWRYGALRWLRADRDRGVEAGVELLSSQPLAVAVYALDAGGMSRAPIRGILIGAGGEARGGEQGILVPRPFVRDAVMLEVLRIDDAAADTMPRPVRVASYELLEAGLYQKIVLPDEALVRIVHG